MRLELRGITKVFGSLVANDHIDLVVEPGEIHALLGENGAGKSTLMNVLYGFYDPDGGEILVDGTPVTFKGPGEAMAAGIGMVHQHFMLVPVFTVAENVVLGHEPTGPGGIIDLQRARAQVREISDRFGFHIDPDALVEDLSVGAQQRVEIIKALSREAEVLILDEPTAVLTPQETDELIEIMRQLKASGTSIVFITHKLREVRAVADRITVIRRGKVVGEAQPSSTETELASLMVGRTVDLGVDKVAGGAGRDHVLGPGPHRRRRHRRHPRRRRQLRRRARRDPRGRRRAGQRPDRDHRVHPRPHQAGARLDPARRHRAGRARRRPGAARGRRLRARRTAASTASSASSAWPRTSCSTGSGTRTFGGRFSMDLKAIRANADHRIGEFDIRTQGPEQPAGRLSGGNQQKVVMARELSRPLKLFVASQPTRGVDVGSIEFLHQRIVAERDHGTPVIIVSTELDEVLELGDRIAVMYRGRIVGIVPGGTDRDVLGLMMAGVPQDEAEKQAAGAPHHARQRRPVQGTDAGSTTTTQATKELS